MFDTSVGRWMQEDPIRFDAGDVNLGRYVGNGPTNATDPSGSIMKIGKVAYGSNVWTQINSQDAKTIKSNPVFVKAFKDWPAQLAFANEVVDKMLYSDTTFEFNTYQDLIDNI